MSKFMYFISSMFICLLVMVNIQIGTSFDINQVATAQSGTWGDVFYCYEHPDNCNSNVAGCDRGAENIEACMINCPPYNGSPWIYCDGNSDPGED